MFKKKKMRALVKNRINSKMYEFIPLSITTEFKKVYESMMNVKFF